MELRSESAMIQRVRRQALSKGPAWSPQDMVVVPAVYNRWGALETQAETGSVAYSNQRPWALENRKKHRRVFLYQRLNESEPHFVPNNGYEGSVYLRFIIDHYHNLPPLMVFVQDDYTWSGAEDCLNRSMPWTPLASVFVRKRGTSFWPDNSAASVEQCWRDLADIFALPGFHPKQEPIISFYALNNFAVSRQNILRRPLRMWQAAYEKVISPKCHADALNLRVLSEEALNASGWKEEDIHYDTVSTKHTSGGALEHLANMIYGFEGLLARERGMNDTCSSFAPSSVCPRSWCRR